MATDHSTPARLSPPTQLRRLADAASGVGPLSESHSLAEPDLHDWRRIAAAIFRFKWVVIGVALGGTAAAVGVSRFIHPAYATHATMWIDAADVDARGYAGPIQSGQLVGSSGWVDLLESHAVLEDVVRRLRLYLSLDDPGDSTALASFGVKETVRPGAYKFTVLPGGRFALTTDTGDPLQQGALGDSVGPTLGFTWAPPAGAFKPGRAIEFSVSDPGADAQELADELHVQTDLLQGKVGNFVTLELRGSSPEQITAIVNAIAERFVTVAAELRRQKLSELVSILDEQVQRAHGNLAQAEQALQEFRVRNVSVLATDPTPLVTSPTQPRDPAATGLFDLRVSLEQMRSDRLALERLLGERADSGISTDALETIGSVQRSSALTQALRELTDKQAELRALRYRYTDSYVGVRRTREELATLERQAIPTMVRELIVQLKVREADGGRRVDSLVHGLRQLPPLTIQEARLQRDVTIAEQLFTSLQQRYAEARLSEVSSIAEVRVLDRAQRPQLPLFNLGRLVIALGFLGSCGVGVLGAVVLDRLDSRVRHPEQVTRTMGLAILGAVPHTSNGKDADTNAAIEALRAIRLQVVHAHGTAGPIVVTITSPGRSDGKSFVVSNLALAFAEGGYRTLLVDGDVRRGALHHALQAARKPGLTELLDGSATLEQVVQATGYPSLWFVGCGGRRQIAPELVASEPMAKLLRGLRSSYDVILVDSPPLAAGADAYALGTMTGALLLVLRAGYSNRELAEAKLAVLDRLPIRVLGAVLNDVRLGGEYRYYSYYMEGYEMRDEPPEARRRVLQPSD